jgi:multidrug efflux pump subunit AcrA (membrane-fusion protein)
MPLEFSDIKGITFGPGNGHAVSQLDEIRRELRSEKVQEIVSDKPGFLVKWGNLFFLLILILLVMATWFIKYPDVIQASAKLTSINAPKPVISLVGGKLVKLSITENQSATKGQILGYIESTANHEEVLQLASTIDTIQMFLVNNKADQIKKYFNGVTTSLGELQTSYQVFSQAFLSFNNYLTDGFYIKKKAMLLRDKNNLARLYKNLDEQRQLQEQDLTLIQKTFDANESLKKDKVISDFDYRIEQSKLINKKLTLPQIRSTIISNESQQNEKEKEIIELENTINQQKLIFQQSLSTFKSQLDEWKKKYTLIAPISGKVAFASFVQENQQLQTNQIICFINPENSQYFAEIVIPQANFGKVAIGQQVLFKFQSYPFQEYGSVIGKIEFISHIPDEKGYLAKVNFTNGLTTTYKKQVQYRDGLLANAEVITQNMRLLERFYYTILKQVIK